MTGTLRGISNKHCLLSFFFIFIFLKAYVMKLERNYIDIWGSGGDSPQKPAIFQRIR